MELEDPLIVKNKVHGLSSMGKGWHTLFVFLPSFLPSFFIFLPSFLP
jgi:hypothetical protein